MHLGVITTRDGSYHPNLRLMEAAGARGHGLDLIHPHHHRPMVADGLVSVQGPCPHAQVILPRVGAEISDYTLGLVRAFELMGRRVVNQSAAIGLCRNQAYTQEALAAAGLPGPGGVLVNNLDGLLAAADTLGGWPLVAKSLSSRQGRGVHLLHSAEDARALGPDIPPRFGVLLQRFIPPKGRRDVRVLTVGGQVAGAMELEPLAGDFRANYHLTGRARAFEPGVELAELALAAAAVVGLEIAGVDLILAAGGPLVMEVNSTPGFKGLEQATGRDIAGLILDWIEL